MTITLSGRALTVQDASAIAAVHAALEADEPTDELYSEADALELLQSPAVDLQQSSVGLFDGERLIGFGLLSVRSREPVFKATLIGGVLPQHTGRGVGRRIVAELEAAAVRDRDRAAPGNPLEFKVFVHDHRRRAVRLMQANGYRPWRYFFRMRRELTGALPEIDLPTGIRIRPYRDTDEQALLRVSNESFADHWGSTPMDLDMWRAEFSTSVAARPAHSWVAVASADPAAGDPHDGDSAVGDPAGDDIVGFVLSLEYDGDTELRGFRSGYLARIGTLRRARGRGVASALIATTLRGMAADGYRCAELDVDADSPTGAGRIYQRAEFAVLDRSTLLGKRI
jgi:ribosomal protein S18 acetylase RimI-like enzyme